MKVRLDDIINELHQDVDSAVVEDFYNLAQYKEPTEDLSVNNVTDKLGFINTNDAGFQLLLRDFINMI